MKKFVKKHLFFKINGWSNFTELNKIVKSSSLFVCLQFDSQIKNTSITLTKGSVNNVITF